MKNKKLKFCYALMCQGHFVTNELYQTKRKAEKESKSGYHRKCLTQVVALRLH